MKYNPKDASQALPIGDYDAVILRVDNDDKDGRPLISKKSGEAMQCVTFEIYTVAGAKRQVRQYFTERSLLWFYKKLAVALGQKTEFDAGSFDAADHIGTNIRVTLDIEDDPDYGEQNRIRAFHPSGTKSTPRMTPSAVPADKDDIPF